MGLPRFPALAVAVALMAAALVAITASSRRTVTRASTTVAESQASKVQQALRGDLADLGTEPSPDELAQLLRERANEGLRYIALLDERGHVISETGNALGERVGSLTRPGRTSSHVGDRIRIEVRQAFRRAWAGRTWWVLLEIEPVAADELRDAASRTLAIGVIAGLTLLGVAIALVRRELLRGARERELARQQRLASLGEMSAVLAHEIRNPLASLKGNAQLLVAQLPEGEKPRAKAERVVDEAIRLEKLTGDLLAFVRTGELARVPVDVAALVGGLAAPGAVEVDVPAPLTWSLDGERLRQVLVNLVDNGAAAGPPPVKITARATGAALVIEVTDHGPGVPAGERERIFEPFFTKKTKGTGLGLAIARRVVEAHGGTIAAGDAPGGGALFRVTIPR